MKSLSLLLILCIPLLSSAQQIIEVDQDNITTIIFESPIKKRLIGAEEYIELFDSKGEKLIALKYAKTAIKKGVKKNTNLIVITENGDIHQLSLRYNKNAKQYENFVKAKKEVKNLDKIEDVEPLVSYYSDGITTIESNSNSGNSYSGNKIEHIKKYCQRTQFVKKKIFKTFGKSFNVKLSLKLISYDRDELYFHFSLVNKGGQTYDIENTFYELEPIGGNSSKQNPELLPLFVFEKPKRIKGNTTVHFTVVFEKFSLDNDMNFEINIAEKEGARDLTLDINNKLINNPVKL